jgi:hypothetical protein
MEGRQANGLEHESGQPEAELFTVSGRKEGPEQVRGYDGDRFFLGRADWIRRYSRAIGGKA